MNRTCVRYRAKFAPEGRFTFISRETAAELVRLHGPMTICAPIRGARLLKGNNGLLLIIECV